MSSQLLMHQKDVEEDGSIVEVKIWRVPKSEKTPEEVRYSLYWVKGTTVLVGYDNHHPKGHHRHYGGTERPYHFETIGKLILDFEEDRRRIKNENQKNSH